MRRNSTVFAKAVRTVVFLAFVFAAVSPLYAADFHVNHPVFFGAPTFSHGPEAGSDTIYNVRSADRQINKQTQQSVQNMNAASDRLQLQADENAKKLAAEAGNGTLKELEQKLRDHAAANGNAVEINSGEDKWEAVYTKVAADKSVRTDTATVDFKTQRCTVVTRVKPFGVTVFAVSQYIKK